MDTESIGGYFELELTNKQEFFKNYIKLNTGRNCLEYVLRASSYTKIYLPYYTCDVLLEPINKLNIAYDFYDIDINLEPIFDLTSLTDDDAFLYTNYFGVKDKYVKNIISKIPENLIIDNSQALFSKPDPHVSTFYSPRKFVGIPDGGFLLTDKKLNAHIQKDYSYERMSHLLKRIDLSAEMGYFDFGINDKSLNNQNIKEMSNLTRKLLSNIDFDAVKNKRKENFSFLNENLKEKNLLNIALDLDSVPMIYPFRTKDKNLKSRFIENKIYCASYWPNVFQWCDENMNSYQLAEEIIALPIDQRYSINDMKKILQYV